MSTIILIVWMHFFQDFVFQSDKMAKGKSTSMKWLSIHVAVYTLPFFIFGWRFALLNGAIHFVVDFFTSRLSSRMHKAGRIHDFFVVIGADQAIHITTLMLTMRFIR